MKLFDLKNKKIGLVGLGVSNLQLANYLTNFTDNIFVTEQLPFEKIKSILSQLHPSVKYECGGHTDKIFDSDIVIRSPGIPLHNPLIKRILGKNIPIFTELELAYQILISKLGSEPLIIAITGTNGKTTTTTLIGKICSSFKKTVVCGNIGEPLTKFLDSATVDTIFVIEVSSYQLEDIVNFKPKIGCILNITEDHLEHHLSMENYIKSKFNIFKNMTQNDYAVLNYDDINIRNYTPTVSKATIVNFSKSHKLDYGCWYDRTSSSAIFNFKNIYESINVKTSLIGEHNLENITAAITCCLLTGIPKDIIENEIKQFRGVEHRLEFVREINGVIYINDSKSTNVNSTVVALKSFSNPVHLILGGRDKGAPYTPLIPLIKQKVKSLLLIGEATDVIYQQLKDLSVNVYKCETLENAVKKAKEISVSGDVVLLSPACSSFDQFTNYEHRGKVFKHIVENL
ncbi:MAG: UDP-N-acetylmuramoyl-L-alanine--D-glutamate ligase [Endomicrobia bacterium]|nr:UDP-N-acetylmuramoyl-L-alanine--D-glutamate ligase [Endomicrobiia bacterium]